MLSKTILAFAFTVNLCYSFQPQHIFYKLIDQNGDGLIMRNKQPDLLAVAPTIADLWRSSCANGDWYGYDGLNYTGKSFHFSQDWDDNLHCYGYGSPYGGYKSFRYLGPEETTRQTISIYETAGFVGVELVIDSTALTNLPFLPKAIFTTGRSNWTLYSGVNFSGNSSCFRSTAEYHNIPTLNSSFVVNSVLRGCNNRRIDNVIYGNELEATEI